MLSTLLPALATVLVFQNARVFDGEKVLPSARVVVQAGRITAVGRDAPIPPGAKIIDAAGSTLLPGFIDAHAHVWNEGQLRQALAFGVTTVLDMLTDPAAAAKLRKQSASSAELADLRSSGFAVTSPKGHGTEYGMVVPTLTDPAKAQAFVDARIAEGSDYIKIIYDDGARLGRTIPTLSKATLQAAIVAAHARNKLAVVHAESAREARDAILANADGLMHVFYDQAPDPAFAPLVARHHAFVVPTLSVLHGLTGTAAGAAIAGDKDLAPYLSAAATKGLKSNRWMSAPGLSYGHAEEAVRRLRAEQAPILAGTDAPNDGTTHGASTHGELELLVRAGLSPLEALVAATAAVADGFHLADRGRIAVGRRADLVLVKGDPTTEIKATRHITGIWKNGQAVDRHAFGQVIAAERAQAALAAKVPPPPGSESGLISDFEQGKPTARFGFGWEPSSDQLVGGASTAALTVVAHGAQRSKGALQITGDVKPGAPFPWAGAMFYASADKSTPANLSSKQQLSFFARGTEGTYRILIFTQAGGYVPAIQTFHAGPEWTQVTLPVSAFGIDAHDLIGIFFGGGPAPGKLSLQLDDVQLR